MNWRSPALASLIALSLLAACSGSADKDDGLRDGLPADAAAEAGPEPAGLDPCSQGSLCDGKLGLCRGLPACSQATPCTDVFERKVTDALTEPRCRTTARNRPAFDDGSPRRWKDSQSGEDRAACVFRPAGASAGSPRPLVVFLHGWSGSADGIYDSTLLRQKAANFDLGGNGAGPGFFLVSDQGPNRRLPPGEVAKHEAGGSLHDHYYRAIAGPGPNADVQNADRLIDELVAEGGVDRSRIYVMGWSNGCHFAQLYGIERHQRPTPGGNRVAAAAVYSCGDPFGDLAGHPSPSCQMDPRPVTRLPIFFIHRNCDSAACDAAQQRALNRPPSNDATAWIATLRGPMQNPNVIQVTIDASGRQVGACLPASLCTPTLAGINHLKWPDGVSDVSGKDWEHEMLTFLREHPLP
jgi:poly(3-hydroxybutyrate) depolymerase